MTGSSTYSTPLGVDIAVSPLDEVKSILYPFVHLVHGLNLLSLVAHTPTTVHTLAADATGKDGKRLHAHILAELEILEVTNLHGLVVTPGILDSLTCLLGTNGCLPTIGIPETITTTVCHTTTGETHELGIQTLESLCQVLTYTMTMIGVLRYEADHIYVQLTDLEHQDLQIGVLAIL